MANAKIAAAQEVRRFADTVKAVISMADDLEKFGSYEQAMQEAAQLKDRTMAEIDEAKAELKKHKDAVKKVKEELANVSDRAQEARAVAEREGVEQLEAKAAHIKDLEAQIESLMEQARRAADSARQAVIDAAREQKEVQERLTAELAAQIVQRQGELTDVEAKLAKARSAIAKLGVALSE